MNAKINWFGLAGGIVTLVVVIASLYIPWWQISVGEFAKGSVSPVNTNFEALGTGLTIPLLWAINIIALLFLVTSGAVMLVYSVLPSKPYSKHLLGFAYKKPLFIVIFFIISLIAIPLILQAVLNISIPLNGTSTVAIPMGFLEGMTVSFLISAGFLWTFWLAIVAAGLCIAARLYHRKVAFTPEVKTVDSAPATPSPQSPSPEPPVPPAPTASPAPTTTPTPPAS
jgi:hypothetical protein